jgi:hypothetical protein
LNDVTSSIAIAAIGFDLSVSLHPGLNGEYTKLSDVTNQVSVLTKELDERRGGLASDYFVHPFM